MATVLREESHWIEARAVSTHEFLHGFQAEECQRILERLNSRTTTEIKRDLELRSAATARLADPHERRSDCDRRSGRDRRRSGEQKLPPDAERRTGGERRAGRERRSRAAT